MKTPSNRIRIIIFLIPYIFVIAIIFFFRKWFDYGGLEYLILALLLVLIWISLVLGGRYLDKDDHRGDIRSKMLPENLGEMIKRAILQSSPESFAVTDLSGRMIFCSQQTAQLHGYKDPAELIGGSFFALFPPKETTHATEFLQLARQGGIVENVEFTLLKKDGTEFLGEITASVVKNEVGVPAAVMATVRDITERRWVEEQIRESEARYRIVADNTFDWEFWQAPNDRFIYTSPSCKRVTGWDAIEFIRNPGLVLDMIHAEDKPKFEAHAEDAKKNRIAGEIDFRITRADGEERWISHICQPVFDDNGAYIGTRGSNRDITERKKAEDDLQLANEKLRLQLAEIEALQIILREQALHDPLTGLYNRRYMEESLRKELARATREDYQVTIALLDMDNLKVFNDNFGHAVGDKALMILSKKLRELTRADDIVCRYGGDEFLVILHKTNLYDGFKRVEQWRETLEGVRIVHEGQELRITFTAGVATFPVHGRSLEEMIKAADDALYKAKRQGRNVVVAPDEPT